VGGRKHRIRLTRSRIALRTQFNDRLIQYEQAHGALRGIRSAARRQAFVEQLIDSVRRVQYVSTIQARDVAPDREVPYSPLFDPLKAARLLSQHGNFEDACWLVFLAIHCGRHRSDGWKLVRDMYGGDGPGAKWTWLRVSGELAAFRHWLEVRSQAWRINGAAGRFGNHRRYESLNGMATSGTGQVVESYVCWVTRAGSHRKLIDDALASADDSETSAFDRLYRTMAEVHRFGRLGRFDYLCMLSKLGLAEIEPGSPYLAGSSGPLKGARLMAGPKTTADLDAQMAALARVLEIGMQSIEDALCNWQKKPDEYKPFRG
jgi:hypothetical protein